MASRSLGQLTLDLIAKIGGFTGPLSKAEREADKKLTAMERRAKQFGERLGSSLRLGITVASGLIATGFGIYIKNTIEAEKVQAQLAAVVNSTGQAAGLSVTALNSMSDSLSRVTTYSNESITSAQSLLLTFTKIGKDVFPQAIETILNMSTAMGTDLKGSAIQLGKALNDPIKGVSALAEVGVTFTESQKKAIEQMVKLGDTAGAQKIILKELEVEFGNSARSARDTLGGALQGLQNDFNDLMTGDTGSEGVIGTTQAINDFSETLRSPEVKQGIDNLANGLVRLINLYTEGAAAAFNFTKNSLDVLGAQGPRAGQGKKVLELSKSQLTKELSDISSGDSAAIRRSAILRQSNDVEQLKSIIKADLLEINKELNKADFSGVTGGINSGVPVTKNVPLVSDSKKTKIGKKDNSAEELKRQQEKDANDLKEAYQGLNDVLDQQAQILGGPLVDAAMKYRDTMVSLQEKEDEFRRLGKLDSETQTSINQAREQALGLYQKEIKAIEDKLTPYEQLIEDMKFENEQIGLSNAEQFANNALRREGIDLLSEQGKAMKQSIIEQAEAGEALQRNQDAIEGFKSSFEDAFAGILDGSKSIKEAFTDLADSILAQISRMIAQQWVDQLFGSGGGGSGGGASNAFGSLLSSWFGGGMATGGNAKKGMFYEVNENGPEMLSYGNRDYLMMGNQSGKITPNHMLGNGGGTNNITINVPPTTQRKSAQQIAMRTEEKLRTATHRNM